MKVAVIVPTYNGAQYLAATLKSVVAQTITDWELIVVDDGSRDDTVAIARQFARCDARIRVHQQANSGVGAARNRGFEEASKETEFFAFLDQDDLLDPNALALLCGALEAHPGSCAAHGDARYVDGDGKSIRCGELEAHSRRRRGMRSGKAVEWRETEPTTFAVLAYWNCIHTPGQAVIRRSALRQIGLFDTQTSLPDVDIWLRLARLSDLVYVNKVVLDYRWHETNTSRQADQMDEGIRYVRRKLLRDASLNAEQRGLALLGTRLWQRDVARLRWQWAKQEIRGRRFLGAANQLRHALISYRRTLWGMPV